MVKKIPHYQCEIIVAKGNFHGRTISIISFTSEDFYKQEFGPFTPGFVTVPYGDIEAIKSSINSKTAAIMLEPIQGEAGVIIPPDGYLKAVEEVCRENNILFVTDEIQTGLGRTGKLFAYQYENVRPDIVIIGKALSGGFYPVSAILADSQLMNLFQPGEHGSTFGGNPLGAAVARAALKVIRDENLVENSAELGKYFINKLRNINSRHIKEIRGRGLFIGVELKPEANGARRFCEILKQKGILAKETHVDTIRFAPPLIIDKQTIDWALPLIEETLMIE